MFRNSPDKFVSVNIREVRIHTSDSGKKENQIQIIDERLKIYIVLKEIDSLLKQGTQFIKPTDSPFKKTHFIRTIIFLQNYTIIF